MEHYQQALALKEKLLGSESPGTAVTPNNLARLLTSARRLHDGVPLLESAVAILEKQLRQGHLHLVLAHENLETAKCSL